MKIQNRKFMLIWMKTQCRQGAIPLRVLRAGLLLIEIKTILFSLTFHRPNPLICFQYLLEINPFVHIFFRSDNTITNQGWSFGNLVAGQIHFLDHSILRRVTTLSRFCVAARVNHRALHQSRSHVKRGTAP